MTSPMSPFGWCEERVPMWCEATTRSRLKRLAALGLACTLVCGASAAGAQPAPAERVVVQYTTPTNPAHQRFHDMIKDNRGLERVRDVLLPVRWPRPLRIELKSCDEANAWYEDGAVTVCYEYLDQMWTSANASG